MSGAASRVSSTLKIEKVKDPENEVLSLEEKKAKLEADLATAQAEKERLDAEIAEQNQLKAEQAAAALAEKVKRADEEEQYFLQQAKEASEKRKKLLEEVRPSTGGPEEKAAAAVKEIHEEMINEGAAHEVQAPVSAVSPKDEPRTGIIGRIAPVFRKILPFLQVLVLGLFLGICWGGFKYYEWKIDRFNSSLSEEQLLTQKINPYNDANIQRMFFEGGIIGFKVAIAFLILFVVSPMIIKYIVPFLKGKVNFYEDFISVEPWVRLLVVSFLFYTVLHFLGLTATVNTY